MANVHWNNLVIVICMPLFFGGCSSDEAETPNDAITSDAGFSMDMIAAGDGTIPILDATVDDDMTRTDSVVMDMTTGESDGMICGTVSARALGSKRPVDVIWAIDSSPSMRQEIETVEANLNAFAQNIGRSNLDYRVVMIGSDRDLEGGVDIPEFHDHIAICVPPPLSGAAGCPDTDSATYFHARVPIHSDDALTVLMASFPSWQNFIRAEARQHVVIVSDDDHRERVSREDLVAMGLGADFYLHSIVNPIDYVDGCAAFGEPDGVECGCGDDRGRTYIDISEGTGGLVLNLCQDDWSPIFAGLSELVEQGSDIPCAFDIPQPNGAILDFARINVDFIDTNGQRTALSNTDDCTANPTGWRYDDPMMPRRIILCPEVCGDRDGEVEVEFGCDTRKH